MEKYSERRTHERFSFCLPCLLCLNEDGVGSDVMELETRDISACGAFLKLHHLNGFSASASVDIIIPPDIIKCTEATGTHISTWGSIVRAEPDGIAVAFMEGCWIAPLDKVEQFIRKKIEWLERQKSLISSNAPLNLRVLPKRIKADDLEKWKMERG